MGNPPRKGKKKANNHYVNLQKKRKKTLEQAKNNFAKKINAKNDMDIEENNINVEKTGEMLGKTILTTMQKSHPSEVTSDSSMELEVLKEKLRRKEQEIEEMKQAKKVKRIRKKKEFTQTDWQVRNIAKQQIFRKVKFITCTEQLDKYLEKNSIGHYFFKCYTEHVENSSIIGSKGEFWSTAKNTVYEAINEKRNAVQTAIKKKWQGTT